MQRYEDCPQILRDFLSYHETIKGQSPNTISEYMLDLRMFLRFMKQHKSSGTEQTALETIDIRDIDLDFIRSISMSDVYDFLSFLAHDRIKNPGSSYETNGIEAAARARKLNAIKSFYKYLTVRTRLLSDNPVADMEYPKLRQSLPRYLTLEETQLLLTAVSGRHRQRDLAILMIFLNCGVRVSELVGLNLSDIYDDRLRVLGKGDKERIVYFGSACKKAINEYIDGERAENAVAEDRALFLSQKKERISVDAVQRLLKKHLKTAGLDPNRYSPHKLRHTAATLMIANGVDVKSVQEVLGHSHLNTTQIYTHIESTELKLAAEANPISKIDLSSQSQTDPKKAATGS